MSDHSDDVKAPYEWIKSWGVGDDLISDENYGEEEISGIKECVDAGAACIHMHPRHPDDGKARLHDTKLTVKMIVDLCKVLGREVATVAEAREIMNIHRTS